MEFFELIEKRKSIRKFKNKPIENWKIKKILEAAILAPSAGNLQAYKIFVIRNKRVKERLAEACYGQSFIKKAPVVLVFCADPKESEKYYGKRGKVLYSLQDATIAATFAMLATYEVGLSCCWVGAFQDGKVKKILRTNLRPVAVLPIGYSDESPPKRKRKKLKEIIEVI